MSPSELWIYDNLRRSTWLRAQYSFIFVLSVKTSFLKLSIFLMKRFVQKKIIFKGLSVFFCFNGIGSFFNWSFLLIQSLIFLQIGATFVFDLWPSSYSKNVLKVENRKKNSTLETQSGFTFSRRLCLVVCRFLLGNWNKKRKILLVELRSSFDMNRFRSLKINVFPKIFANFPVHPDIDRNKKKILFFFQLEKNIESTWLSPSWKNRYDRTNKHWVIKITQKSKQSLFKFCKGAIVRIKLTVSFDAIKSNEPFYRLALILENFFSLFTLRFVGWFVDWSNRNDRYQKDLEEKIYFERRLLVWRTEKHLDWFFLLFNKIGFMLDENFPFFNNLFHRVQQEFDRSSFHQDIVCQVFSRDSVMIILN